jgi:heme/copper-type cytochrome/quinol oxidase subunit 3
VLNFENFRNARWSDLYAFFAQGSPPLGLQLLVINTIFLAFVVFRRATAKHQMRKSSAYAIQAVLIAANLIFMFQKEAVDAASSIKQIHIQSSDGKIL